MERIMNEENEWDQNVQATWWKGILGEEVVKLGLLDPRVSVEMIAAMQCHGGAVSERLDCRMSVVPGGRGRMSCGAYRGVKLLEHNEDVEKGEENAAYDESGRDAIWFYARQRNNRCSVHFKEVTRLVLRQGEEVVYVLC